VATERESASTAAAIRRECDRYGLEHAQVVRVFHGEAPPDAGRREWWDWLILACAAGLFIVLGLKARVPALHMTLAWAGVLAVVLVASAAVCTRALGKATRFS